MSNEQTPIPSPSTPISEVETAVLPREAHGEAAAFAPDALKVMYRCNGETCWWAVLDIPQVSELHDGDTFTYHLDPPQVSTLVEAVTKADNVLRGFLNCVTHEKDGDGYSMEIDMVAFNSAFDDATELLPKIAPVVDALRGGSK